MFLTESERCTCVSIIMAVYVPAYYEVFFMVTLLSRLNCTPFFLILASAYRELETILPISSFAEHVLEFNCHRYCHNTVLEAREIL